MLLRMNRENPIDQRIISKSQTPYGPKVHKLWTFNHTIKRKERKYQEKKNKKFNWKGKAAEINVDNDQLRTAKSANPDDF